VDIRGRKLTVTNLKSGPNHLSETINTTHSYIPEYNDGENLYSIGSQIWWEICVYGPRWARYELAIGPK
jgi:hypothetical protein